MKQWGLVIQVSGGKALVEVCGQSGCKNCGQCLSAQKSQQVWVDNTGQAQVGERVCLYLPAKRALASGFILYLLPLILLLTGFGLMRNLFPGSELVGALAGFLLSLLIGHLVNKRFEKQGKLVLAMVAVEKKKS